jgi:hypothetical protein
MKKPQTIFLLIGLISLMVQGVSEYRGFRIKEMDPVLTMALGINSGVDSISNELEKEKVKEVLDKAISKADELIDSKNKRLENMENMKGRGLYLISILCFSASVYFSRNQYSNKALGENSEPLRDSESSS